MFPLILIVFAAGFGAGMGQAKGLADKGKPIPVSVPAQPEKAVQDGG